jgi:predicted ribosomally synthesized peptide with SipW-like signal peptide
MNNNQKATKRALLTSVMALVMCVVMLVGTTFAWFTDTASTAVNKIVAGNLKVDIVDENGKSVAKGSTKRALDFVSADNVTKGVAILWEPNCTYLTEGFQIKNAGNLALKWKVEINKDEVTNGMVGSEIAPSKSLLEVIDFSIVDANDIAVSIDEFTGHILPADNGGNTGLSGVYKIKAHMDENAGNDYQNLTLDGITITVYATQDTVEFDSFGKDYDKNATYPVVVSQSQLNASLTLDALKDENGKVSPVEVTLGNTAAEDINYSQNNSGYTGKGVMLGSTKLNKYAAAPAAAGQYKFTFKDGTITSAATGYASIDGFTDTSVYMLVPGNSDVVFENMTFNGVVSFDIQKYTSPWSNLNSITFKNCIFNGIIIGTCPASNVTFDGCTFNKYTNTTSANNSNPIWWREDTEGSGANANPIKTFTFVNNTVTGTRPVKIERIGKTVSPVFTIKNNTFDIKAQTGDTVTKNMAINIGMGENPNLPFTLIDDGNTTSRETAALYTASLTGGSNWYKATSGMKVLDGNGNAKVITAMVWKTTTNETFELKSVD